MAVLGFLMPPETGEKINMIITTLLSMGVYLQSINESIPPTSEAVPLIGSPSPSHLIPLFRNVLRRLAVHGLSGYLCQCHHPQYAQERGCQSGTACPPLDGEIHPGIFGNVDEDTDQGTG